MPRPAGGSGACFFKDVGYEYGAIDAQVRSTRVGKNSGAQGSTEREVTQELEQGS